MQVSEDRKAKMREYNSNHAEERKQKNKEWRDRNPDKIREYNHRQYLRRKAQKEAERENQT